MKRRRQVMLMVETSLAYGRSVLRGISQYVVAHQPWSIYLDLRELIVEPPAWLDRWQGDGVISRTTTPELAQRLRQLQIPTVDLTDIHGDLGLPHIWSDHLAVGRMAAEHLLERGFRNFAYCGFSGHDWSMKRGLGFRETVEQGRGTCQVLESPWESREHSWEEQQQAIVKWLRALPKPVGIMACNDLRGQHVLDACRRLELAVPEQAAVIGVDNDEYLCGLCDPPLSSVVPHAERIGYEAAALLDRLMQGQSPPFHELLVEPRQVVTRQSTDVLAIDDPQIAAAVKLIRERSCEGLTVAQLLHHVPLSRSVLERRFRKFVQCSPQEMIRAVQLKRVQQLLTETDLALERIAELAGYPHPEYMSVVFKRELGLTPGQFRRQTAT